MAALAELAALAALAVGQAGTRTPEVAKHPFFQPLLFHKVSESEEQLGTGNLKTRILFNLFTRAAQTLIFLILKMKKMNKCRNFLRHE